MGLKVQTPPLGPKKNDMQCIYIYYYLFIYFICFAWLLAIVREVGDVRGYL